MREAEFQHKVVDLVKELGLRSWHCVDMRRSEPGWPDLVIIGKNGKGILFRELKAAEGVVSVEQLSFLRSLRAAGEDAEVWRPQDWHSRRVLQELLEIR